MQKERKVCKASLLMGCSSCALQRKGKFDSTGFALDFMGLGRYE
jgi:hypothetical protein